MHLTNENKERFINFYEIVCNEMIQKNPEKKSHYQRLMEEANNYCIFPLVVNMADLIMDNIEILDLATVKEYICMTKLFGVKHFSF